MWPPVSVSTRQLPASRQARPAAAATFRTAYRSDLRPSRKLSFTRTAPSSPDATLGKARAESCTVRDHVRRQRSVSKPGAGVPSSDSNAPPATAATAYGEASPCASSGPGDSIVAKPDHSPRRLDDACAVGREALSNALSGLQHSSVSANAGASMTIHSRQSRDAQRQLLGRLQLLTRCWALLFDGAPHGPAMPRLTRQRSCSCPSPPDPTRSPPSSSAISLLRARASRLITVPIGISRISAA